MILVRLDPAQAGHGAHVDPARPDGRHPRPRPPEDQRRLRARRDRLTLRTVTRPAGHPDQPRRRRQLRRLPRRRQPPRLRLRRRRPQLLQRQQPAQRRRRPLRDDRHQRRLPEALRPGRARLRALPPPRRRPRPRRAPAVVPAPGQGPDRPRQRLLRPQGAAADLRPYTQHRHRSRHTRDPAPPEARARVGRRTRSRRSSSRPDAGDGSGTSSIGPSALQAHGRRASWRARATTGPREHGEVARAPSAASAAAGASRPRSRGLIRNRKASENIAAPLQVKLGRLPVYYPTPMSARGSYRVDDPRAYDIFDRANKRTAPTGSSPTTGGNGQYYGVQGTTGARRRSSTTRRRACACAGARYKLFYDGSRLSSSPGARADGVLLGLQHAAAHADERADARARPLDAVARRPLGA